MWKSTSSWARGTEGDTGRTGGSEAYKKTLSFPPVHGFREWSVKQENPTPGSSFQAGSRLMTETRQPVPTEVCTDVARALGDRLYKVYSDAMKIKQYPPRDPDTVRRSAAAVRCPGQPSSTCVGSILLELTRSADCHAQVKAEKIFRFEDAWQGASRPKVGKDVVINHKVEMRRAGPMGKSTGLQNRAGAGKADPRWTEAPGAPKHYTDSIMQKSLQVPKINTLQQWFDQYGKPLNQPPPGQYSTYIKSQKIGTSSLCPPPQGELRSEIRLSGRKHCRRECCCCSSPPSCCVCSGHGGEE